MPDLFTHKMTPNSPGTSPSFYKQVLILSVVSLGYLLLSFLLVGFKTDQLVLIGLVNGLYFASAQSRKFVIGFSIFIVYWIIFDYMKAFPNYRYHAVHLESLYTLEKKLFGITNGASVLTPNEYWLIHRTTVLDVLTGLFYVSWIPIPLLFATYLFFTDRPLFYPLALTFVLVNLLGLYHLLPVPGCSTLVHTAVRLYVSSAHPGQYRWLSQFRPVRWPPHLQFYLSQKLERICRDAFPTLVVSGDYPVLWTEI